MSTLAIISADLASLTLSLALLISLSINLLTPPSNTLANLDSYLPGGPWDRKLITYLPRARNLYHTVQDRDGALGGESCLRDRRWQK